MNEVINTETIRKVEDRLVTHLRLSHTKYDAVFLSHLAQSIYRVAYKYIGRDIADTLDQAPTSIRPVIERTLTTELLKELKKF